MLTAGQIEALDAARPVRYEMRREAAETPDVPGEDVERLERESLKFVDEERYEGKCIAAAIGIMERDTRLSANELAELCGIRKTTFYRMRRGARIAPWKAAGLWEQFAGIRAAGPMQIAKLKQAHALLAEI